MVENSLLLGANYNLVWKEKAMSFASFFHHTEEEEKIKLLIWGPSKRRKMHTRSITRKAARSKHFGKNTRYMLVILLVTKSCKKYSRSTVLC